MQKSYNYDFVWSPTDIYALDTITHLILRWTFSLKTLTEHM